MTRGTPGAYYWLWAWDNMVTGMESFRWGEQALAANMVRFINTHRDIDGSIPARWTRNAEPLDTPPRGALEFLLLHLAYQHALETGQKGTLQDVYPDAVIHLQEIVRQSDGMGLVQNMSFYPDLPLRFGRTDRSIVALETGCLYGLTRVLENVATLFGDHHIQEVSRTLARNIENGFLETFWDQERGFLVDAVDAETGARNPTYPLFSLLFLQTPLGMPLVKSVLPQMAQFVKRHLQTPYGTRMLPSWDIRQGGEEATASWYPTGSLSSLSAQGRRN
jgi:glycogen debranching enzyme